MKFRSRTIFFYMSVVDVLFFPYVRFMSSTITMMPVAIWSLFRFKKIIRSKQNLWQILFLIIAFISYALSPVNYERYINEDGILLDVWRQNTLNFVILLFLFFYYNLVKEARESIGLNLYNVLRFYLLFNALLAVIYLGDYKLYFSLRTFWTLGGDIMSVGDFSSITRFTGIMSDPNNSSIMTVAVYSYLSLYRKLSLKELAVYFALCVVCVISSMSVTGVIAFALTIPVVVLVQGKRDLKGGLSFVRALAVAALLFCILAGSLYFFGETESGAIAFDRLSGGSAESRFQKFDYLLNPETLLKIIIGDGGTVIYNGEIFRPHIGHLHIVLNYGLIAYILFIRSVFWIRKGVGLSYYWPIFVVFVGFTSNTGLLDFRFSMLFAILLGAYHSMSNVSNLNRRGGFENSRNI